MFKNPFKKENKSERITQSTIDDLNQIIKHYKWLSDFKDEQYLEKQKEINYFELKCVELEALTEAQNKQLDEHSKDYTRMTKVLADSNSCLDHANKVNASNILFIQELRSANTKLKQLNSNLKVSRTKLKNSNDRLRLDNSFLLEENKSVNEQLDGKNMVSETYSSDIALLEKKVTELQEQNDAIMSWDVGEVDDVLFTEPKFKTCTKCKKHKLKTDFFKDKCKKDGLQSQCKECKKK